MLTLLLASSSPALAYDLDLTRTRVRVQDAAGVEWKLNRVSAKVPVDASAAEAWALIAAFGEVVDVHESITASHWIGTPEMADGAARYCRIEQGKRVIDIKERVEELKPGSWYQYDVYEWENFPLAKMNNVWGVTEEGGQVYIYNIIDYRLKPAMMSGLVRGTMRKNAATGVAAYKQFLESGDTIGKAPSPEGL